LPEPVHWFEIDKTPGIRHGVTMFNTPPLRWGLIGPGRIAQRFCQDLRSVPGCRLQAVASRDPQRAASFAAEFAANTCHSDYAALAADPAVDIVYIATPHIFHAEQIRLCLEAGKHVLCEKPICISASELAPLISLASSKRLFLMEGLWSRFLPAWKQMRRWIRDGRIGEPLQACAHFGFRCNGDPEGRLLNPALAGGALWDVGIYTLAFATEALGTDLQHTQGAIHRGTTGVDEDTTMLLQFQRGRMATLGCSLRSTLPQKAWVAGTEGRIVLDEAFWKAQAVTLSRANEVDESLPLPFSGTGFQFEIEHVRDSIRDGLLESPIVPLHESLLWQRTMDILLAPAH
jgi:predicted dehydrogenase